MREIVVNAMTWCNAQRKEGRIQNGVPDDVWSRAIAENPPRKPPVEKAHVLLPEKRPVQIRGGLASVNIDGDFIRFFAPEFARLGSRYSVVVCFDPTNPAYGAEILNNETGSRNEKGYKIEEWICHADLEERAPQFSTTSGFVDGNIAKRKQFTRECRLSFGSTGIYGRNRVEVSEHRDGKGTITRVERGKDSTLFAPTVNSERDSEGATLIEQAKRHARSKSVPQDQGEDYLDQIRQATRICKDEALLFLNEYYDPERANESSAQAAIWEKALADVSNGGDAKEMYYKASKEIHGKTWVT